MAQLAEAGGLNPPEYGFESHWGHRARHRSDAEILRTESEEIAKDRVWARPVVLGWRWTWVAGVLGQGGAMLTSTDRPAALRGATYRTSADAFLLGGVVFLLFTGVLVGLVERPSVWSELASQAGMLAALVGGVALAWRLHGRPLTGRAWAGVLLGSVAAGLVTPPVFVALFMLGRFVPLRLPGPEGPWGSILLLVVAAIAFLAVPVHEAVRNLAGRTGDLRVAAVRLSCVLTIMVAVAVTASLGGDAAEVGIFMVPVAAASALAVGGAIWFDRWVAGRHPARHT